MKLARESGQDIMTVDAAGKVAFPQNAQTWQNMAGSRALGTPYTNNTGRDIDVNVQLIGTATSHRTTITIDGVVGGTGTTQATPSSGSAAYARVPPGATYTVTISTGTGTVTLWSELR
jgi:hypothetical protein